MSRLQTILTALLRATHVLKERADAYSPALGLCNSLQYVVWEVQQFLNNLRSFCHSKLATH